MTIYTKERIKTDLDQAKAESKERASRIGAILKDAASMTFSELKEGSAEVNVLTRRSLSELLEELKENPDIVADTETVDIQVKPEPVVDMPAPTWKEIIGRAVGIVRNRKGDWLQQLQEYLSEQATRADERMSQEHGDRYRTVKSALQRLVSLIESARAKASQEANHDDAAKPVNIEVVDGNAATQTDIATGTEQA